MSKSPHNRGHTSEVFDFTEDEIEFMKAIERYRKNKNIRFLAWHQVLEVVKELGYTKPRNSEDLPKSEDSPT